MRMLFDWLITGQVVPFNPTSAVRGPKHVVKTSVTPVLDAPEWRKLVDAIPTETMRDLRDRALVATLTYSFARITAALRMKVEDLRSQGAGWQLRLHEKAGKHHTMPCHHALAEALRVYIDAAGIAEDRKGFLLRTWGHPTICPKSYAKRQAFDSIRHLQPIVCVWIAAERQIQKALSCKTLFQNRPKRQGRPERAISVRFRTNRVATPHWAQPTRYGNTAYPSAWPPYRRSGRKTAHRPCQR